MKLETRPLSPALGVEIRNMDLARDLSPETLAAIEAEWLQHGVVLFRNQTWGEDDQRRLARHFGPVQFPHTAKQAGKDITYVGNIAAGGIEGTLPDGEMVFHHDSAYREKPTRATMLFAIEVPAEGGNTLFASTIRAYEVLDPELRERILGYDIRFNFDSTDYQKPNRDAWAADVPSFVHPLVIRHESGRPLLFCNRLMGDGIEGMPRDAGRALIAQLCDVIERADNIYSHQWHVGDVLLWDNLATVHGRTDFDPAERRWMRRCTVLGERPVAYRDVLTQATA
jgi:taurine dioxygenase